jgi:2-keto-4-pentenoate hydratase
MPTLIDYLYHLSRTGSLDEFGWAALAENTADDVDEGLALQLAVLDRWQADGHRAAGWKIGLSSRGARDSMGEGVRPFGYVLADRVFPTGATIATVPGAKIEPEICVILGTDLGGSDVTPAQARAAVRAVAPAFEIVTPALPSGTSRAVRLGNDLNQWGIVVGPESTPDIDLSAITVTLSRNGTVAHTATSTPDVLDDPYVSLTRVCRHLAAQGRTLSAGDHLITGSLTPVPEVSPGETWQATFTTLGEVTTTFA